MINATKQLQLKKKIQLELVEFSLENTTIEFEMPNEVCRDSV